MNISPKIVFMGTAEFAATQLQTLLNADYQVVTVVTVPDKPAGRGLQMQPSAVKLCAQQHNLPILQPENLRDETFLNALHAYNADIFVVVAFRMLPDVVWQMPPLGTFNLHASLLPQYRGAAPIQWAIINGEIRTGVTTFLLDKNMDTGNILLQKSIDILPTDNAGSLHDKLMHLAGDVILQTINGLATHSITPAPQQPIGELKPAPKLFKANTRIDPNNDVEYVANFVRGLNPYPAAWLQVQVNNAPPQMLKVYEAQAEFDASATTPIGTVLQENDSIKLRCKNGFLHILSVQLAGKKQMKTQDFLRGVRVFALCEDRFNL
ncbi:methionyl-tRNA formyltransferase [Bacteroidia bacterium]|nr:methionyl-tRNA formyltransferase [Bacteroidia bacterium]GHT79984.1 methionyl-tRNA formyltransferase [Bacteroidia bacterium]